MRKPARFYSLKRFPMRIRQSWHKYNLWALKSGAGRWNFMAKTQFQQQWIAKSKSRSYHAEHVTEKQWIRLFSKRLLGAVEMPTTYLAKHDGSEQASGRGSGLSTLKISADQFSKVGKPSTPPAITARNLSVMTREMMERPLQNMTPYMQMIFAPLERRLDTALFRSLFASSVRQARQFCIHGAVRVNGKKMVHPSYLLNPGDMFQVNPERVLFATGQQRVKSDKLQSRTTKRLENNRGLYRRFLKTKGTPSAQALEENAEAETNEEVDAEAAEENAADALAQQLQETQISLANASPSAKFNAREQIYKKAFGYIRRMMENRPDPGAFPAEEAAQIRAFRDTIREGAGRPSSVWLTTDEIIEELENHSKQEEARDQHRWVTVRSYMLSRTPASTTTTNGAASVEGASQENASEPESPDEPVKSEHPTEEEKRVIWEGYVKEIPEEYKDLLHTQWELQAVHLTDADTKYLRQVLRADDENPYDETKPYATPWSPRRYMAPFAFIPRYLEVNQNICAAVYLRHPVARKGFAEVPTPFSYWHGQLAHNWYVRRG